VFERVSRRLLTPSLKRKRNGGLFATCGVGTLREDCSFFLLIDMKQAIFYDLNVLELRMIGQMKVPLFVSNRIFRLTPKNDIEKVCKYIINQPIHHKKQTFAEEYEQFMKFYQQTLLSKKSWNQGG